MSKITVTTIAGATSGADANKVKIESGDTLEVTSNATVGGTLGVTGTTTTAAITSTGRHEVNFNGSGTQAFKYTDTGGGNLASFGQFYNPSNALIANIQNANNDGIHINVKNGSLVFSNVGYTAANALDDYEEGTFTPTFSFTNTNGNHTVTGATGHYVKVGTLVHIQGYIKLATRGTANGNIRIANIPFTNINSGSSYAAGSVWMNTMNSGAPMDGDFMQYMIINPGGDHMRLWCLSGSGSVHEATQGDVQDQSDFMFTITYRHA